MIIRILPYNIILDERAGDGTWCSLPYPNHKKGCPNLGKEQCPPNAPRFKDIAEPPYYAVVVSFDLKAHAERMKEKHPKWSERQCRNLLYWQGGVRKKLKNEAYKLKEDLKKAFEKPFIVLEIPEANGVNVFTTMSKSGKRMEISKPDTIHKVMLVVGDKNGY